GVGYASDSVMCPSAKVPRDRVNSPSGRATMMREWLRQSAEVGFDAAAQFAARGAQAPAKGNVANKPPRLSGAPSPIGTELARVDAEYDFSHEVYQAMDGCLNCRACATQCPV